MTEAKTTSPTPYHMVETESNILICIYIIIMTIGILANSSILMSVFSERSLRKKQHVVLLNLITCDLLTTLLSAPYYIYSVAATAPPKTTNATNLCKGYLFFSYAFGYVAILSMLLISLDRYIAIVHPYIYHKHMNTKTLPLTVLCWMLPFVACFPSTITENALEYDGRAGGFCGVQWSHMSKVYVFVVVSFLFVFPTIAVFLTNIRVYKIARRQIKVSPEQSENRKISNQSQVTNMSFEMEQRAASDFTPPSRRMSVNIAQIFRKQMSQKRKVPRVSKRDVQIAVATLLLIGLYFLSWLPFVIPRILSTSGVEIPRWLISYTPPFVFSSVAWDPLLILWCRNDIRREVLRLLRLPRLFIKRQYEEKRASVTTIANRHTSGTVQAPALPGSNSYPDNDRETCNNSSANPHICDATQGTTNPEPDEDRVNDPKLSNNIIANPHTSGKAQDDDQVAEQSESESGIDHVNNPKLSSKSPLQEK